MDRPQGILSLLRLLPPTARMAFRLMLEARSLARYRRQAIRGFRRGLEEAGVPPGVAEKLAAAYPDLDLQDMVGRGKGFSPDLLRG